MGIWEEDSQETGEQEVETETDAAFDPTADYSRTSLKAAFDPEDDESEEVVEEEAEEDDQPLVVSSGTVSREEVDNSNHIMGRSKYDPIIQDVLDADLGPDEAYKVQFVGYSRVTRLRARFKEMVPQDFTISARQAPDNDPDTPVNEKIYNVFIYQDSGEEEAEEAEEDASAFL